MKHVYPVFHVSICCDLTLDAVLFKVFRPFLRNEDIFAFHSRPSVICTADPGTFAGSSAEQLDQIWVSRSLVGKCRALPAFTPRIVQKNQPNVGSSIYIYMLYIYLFLKIHGWYWGIGIKIHFFCHRDRMGTKLMESPPPKNLHARKLTWTLKKMVSPFDGVHFSVFGNLDSRKIWKGLIPAVQQISTPQWCL